MQKVCRYFALILLTSIGLQASADDQQEAKTASDKIIQLLAAREFSIVWDEHTSSWFKEKTTKQAFLAKMHLGRATLGELRSSSLVSTEFSTASMGYSGKIFAMTYLNKYAGGSFYENIVVLLDTDGKFRLSGIWGSPA